jgi:AcrR family transcriptional regulator
MRDDVPADVDGGVRGAPAITDEEKVPVELARLWRLPATSRLGRRAELDVEQVVRAAVELADRDGLAGVTLPKVAKALGFTTMSLYRYVGSKEELLVLMQDSAFGEPPVITAPAGEWRAGLRQWAAAVRLLNHRRPWLARLPTSGPPSGPNEIAWLESSLQVLRDTGLDWAQKVGIMTLLIGHVRHATLLAQDLERGRAGTGLDQAATERGYARNLAKLVGPDRYPEAAKLFSSGTFGTSPEPAGDDPATEHEFAFGLERILDGIAAVITDPTRSR